MPGILRPFLYADQLAAPRFFYEDAPQKIPLLNHVLSKDQQLLEAPATNEIKNYWPTILWLALDEKRSLTGLTAIALTPYKTSLPLFSHPPFEV